MNEIASTNGGYKLKPNEDGSYTEYVAIGPAHPMPDRLGIKPGYTVTVLDLDPVSDGCAGRLWVEWEWAGNQSDGRPSRASRSYNAEVWVEAKKRAFGDLNFISEIIEHSMKDEEQDTDAA